MLDFGLQNFDPLRLWTSGFRPPWTLDFGILTPLDFGLRKCRSPTGGARMVDTPYVSRTVLMKAIFESFAGHSYFMGDNDS